MTDQPINATSGSAAVSRRLHDAAVTDFIALLKPRVMSLVVFTGFAGMMVAPGSIHPVIGGVLQYCVRPLPRARPVPLTCGIERDLDAVWTGRRSVRLPGGRMEPEAALGFGCVLAGGSVMRDGAWALTGRRRALLALAIRFLRLCLHHLAEAPDAAEYCYRGRCRCLSADDRLGRCTG